MSVTFINSFAASFSIKTQSHPDIILEVISSEIYIVKCLIDRAVSISSAASPWLGRESRSFSGRNIPARQALARSAVHCTRLSQFRGTF